MFGHWTKTQFGIFFTRIFKKWILAFFVEVIIFRWHSGNPVDSGYLEKFCNVF